MLIKKYDKDIFEKDEIIENLENEKREFKKEGEKKHREREKQSGLQSNIKFKLKTALEECEQWRDKCATLQLQLNNSGKGESFYEQKIESLILEVKDWENKYIFLS